MYTSLYIENEMKQSAYKNPLIYSTLSSRSKLWQNATCIIWSKLVLIQSLNNNINFMSQMNGEQLLFNNFFVNFLFNFFRSLMGAWTPDTYLCVQVCLVSKNPLIYSTLSSRSKLWQNATCIIWSKLNKIKCWVF
jgi:hypothetical protein